MQTTLLSANTYFTPMVTRAQAVEDIQSYRDPRPSWSVPDTEIAAVSTTPKKVPTESDDREDYSSDSEKAEDDLDGADWRGGETESPSEDGGFEITTATAIGRAKPLLTMRVSSGESVVVVDAEPASAGAGIVDFHLQNDEDEKTKTDEDGVKEIEDGLQRVNLSRVDSTPTTSIPRGPNGGKPTTKPGVVNESQLGGTRGRRQEPYESTDLECFDGQPTKFIRPNVDQAVHNTSDRYEYGPTMYVTAPRMQIQGQQHWQHPSTGYGFQSPQFLLGTEQLFGTHQGVAPAYQVPSTTWSPGYHTGNHYTQPAFRPTVNQLQYPPNRCDFYPTLPNTFNQPSTTDNGNYQATFQGRPTNNMQCITAPSPITMYQPHPGQDQIVSSMRTMPSESAIQDPIITHDTFAGAPGNSTLSAATVPAHPTSELDIILAWVEEQPETHSLQTPVTKHLPVSSPLSWNEAAALSVTVPSNSGYLPLSSAGHYSSQCNEVTPIQTLTASPYPGPYTPCSQIHANSSGTLAATYPSDNLGTSPTHFSWNVSSPTVQQSTADSPPGTYPPSVSSSTMAVSPPSSAPGFDPADDTGSHYSPGSDNLAVMTSDHGSVANSPSSQSEGSATILIGDETDAERMAQITEAQGIADAYQDLALISQDSQGDTPLHVAMIDDQWYLAESILRRLIRDDILRQIINIRNKLQQTPLCLAVICNRPGIVEVLIEHGADVNVHLKASDDYLGTKFCQPLHLASSRGHLWKQTLKKLLRANNIDLDAFNSDGKSALHCAIEGHGRLFKDETIDCKDTLRMLAERGANLNQPDCGHEKTPLHYAIERRDVDLVSRLLCLAKNHMPDNDLCSVAKMLEAKTGNGNTALHLAASVDMDTVEHKKLIQQLMSKGADPSSKNSDGFLPRELTKNRAIVELLKGRTASGRSPNADKKKNS